MNNHNLNVQGAAISEESFEQQGTRDIVFPHQLEDLAQIAVDIGGSLAKVVYFSRSPDSPGGRLNFVKFETQKIDECVDFVYKVLYDRYHGQIPVSERLLAEEHINLFRERLKVTMHKEDEMECLITGLNFLVRQITYEVFTYDERRPEPMQFEATPDELFPYLLVNIGSGVSILKVTSDETYERISGTSLGGGTLWGLLSLLTQAKSYDEMLELSKHGDNKNVDMLVGDIYGGDYPKIGLKGTAIASSFGKVFKTPAEERSKFKQEDISRSMLAHGIQRIYFSGFFIRGHPITMNTLSYAINFWSKGRVKALFLRHEGYLGAMGAFLQHVNAPHRVSRIGSFTENFSQIQKISGTSLGAVGALDEFPSSLTAFPLLEDPHTYEPDTVQMNEPELQHYWIDLLDKNLGDLVEMVLEWKADQTDTKSRASSFEAMYREHLQRLRTEPLAYGALSIRSLLNLREQCLREMGFTDIFEGVKQKENTSAMEGLATLLSKLDVLDDKEKLDVLIDNVLAGNMYDWGSTSVMEMLRKGELDFLTAKATVGRPAKFDTSKALKERLLAGPAYQKAVIFVDNSGADIVLGIIPFAKYLLSKGTKVILAANTSPSVNDITAVELAALIEKVAYFDATIRRSWADRALQVVGTGSASPCLDLHHVSVELAKACEDVDLVVVEGMGRAIHTNFYATFKVDSLKIAVFKNPQVAKTLGAEMYDAVCLFDSPGSR
ncbi:hypothetical protein HK097_005281 [Rhizophlyctis rosea]|uniref:Damage-control phosphatase ARMT1-like metal-binding domain-containing protein n=1 Tax=Rhizophlyctis rosea TaxID=64517 RepID=A0AAD5SF12_9FUNG|nr:hypothetical protein HK097_005281 [Rhizophlyctis rosea]